MSVQRDRQARSAQIEQDAESASIGTVNASRSRPPTTRSTRWTARQPAPAAAATRGATSRPPTCVSRAGSWRSTTVSLHLDGRPQVEGDVGDHVLLAADQSPATYLGQNAPDIEVVPSCSALGMAQEAGVHPCVPERQ